MSKIDYQKLREIAEKTKIAGEAPVMPFDQRINALNDFMKHLSPDIALALLDELEAADKELSTCKSIMEKIKSTSCHVDTSKGAFIPNSLDAWGRPVPQYLPYDFPGTPGASATQYCNGWNDAGGYWLNHVKYLQECITAAGIITKVGEQDMAEFTKERIIEELKASTQNASGMFEISEDTICALMSMLTNAAPQLPQPAVMHDAATAIRACLDEFPEDVRDIVEECASIAENACRAAMLQCSEPVTDNTNQQFESLSRGDK